MIFSLEFLVFFFLIPLLFYIKFENKFDIRILFLIFTFLALVNFFYFYYQGYGDKFMVLGILAYILFFIPFIYFSKLFIEKSYGFLVNSLFFYCFFYCLHFVIFNNFWINFSSILLNYPYSISIFGSFITTFLIILFNFSLFYILSENKIRKIWFSSLVLFILIFNFFFLNLFVSFDSNFDDSIKVSGIQGNVEKDWFDRYNSSNESLSLYLNLSLEALKFEPEIVIWPEYVFSHPIEFDYDLKSQLNSFALENDVLLVVGSIELENSSRNDSKRFNKLYFFPEELNLSYYSVKPVTVFDRQVALGLDLNGIEYGGKNLGFSLCYEENYPHLYSDLVDNFDSQVLFVVGNQFYVEQERGLELTSYSSKLRAVEQNRYLFRLETSGLSEVISNKGEVVEVLPIKQEGILNYEIPLISEKSFYSKFGKELEFCLFIFGLIFICFGLVFRFLKK